MADEVKNPALADALKDAGYRSEGGEISKRGPGRPPKTTAGVNNTADTYTPSVERNNVDQALQPTGEGSEAGLGGSDISDGAESEKPENKNQPVAPVQEKYFPVLLKRNYRPLKDNGWKIVKTDGTYGDAPVSDDGTSPKASAGYTIALPIDEAKSIIARGIGERADEIK